MKIIIANTGMHMTGSARNTSHSGSNPAPPHRAGWAYLCTKVSVPHWWKRVIVHTSQVLKKHVGYPYRCVTESSWRCYYHLHFKDKVICAQKSSRICLRLGRSEVEELGFEFAAHFPSHETLLPIMIILCSQTNIYLDK